MRWHGDHGKPQTHRQKILTTNEKFPANGRGYISLHNSAPAIALRLARSWG